MSKALVLYYSMYGHVAKMAEAMAEGLREGGSEAVIKRAPETMSREQLEAMGAVIDPPHPDATVDELPDYDAIVIGTPTRFGNMAGQMRTFWDQTGKHWMNGTLIGKVGSVFTSTATGGGNETTLIATQFTLMHHGMVIVGAPYSISELNDISEARGGGPYGAGMLAAPDGSRWPSETELAIARGQGAHVAWAAGKLSA